MACPLCGDAEHPVEEGGSEHPLLRCPDFERVPRPLKEILQALWEWDPQPVPPGEPLALWIYENLFSPGAGPGARWLSWFSRPYGDLPAPEEERVVLSVKGARLQHVWGALLSLFPRLRANDLVQAKRCPPHVADWRPDSVVLVLRDRAAVDRLLDELRALHAAGAVSAADFRSSAPTGAVRVPDLAGVSVAPRPYRPENAAGAELCGVLASVYDATCRPERMPDLLDFALACLVELRRLEVDAALPWSGPVRYCT